MTTTKEELEKKIEEKAKRKCDNTDDRNLFIDGANSLEAKAKWQHGMYNISDIHNIIHDIYTKFYENNSTFTYDTLLLFTNNLIKNHEYIGNLEDNS